MDEFNSIIDDESEVGRYLHFNECDISLEKHPGTCSHNVTTFCSTNADFRKILLLRGSKERRSQDCTPAPNKQETRTLSYNSSYKMR